MLVSVNTLAGWRLNRCLLGGFLFWLALFWGCTPTRSYVVLLPDTDGKVGTLHMKTDTGVYWVNKPYHSVQSKGEDKRAAAVRSVEKQQIEALFGKALEAEPDQQFRFEVFTLHCAMDSIELTPGSQKQLPALVEHLKASRPMEIYVAGHTDRVGSERYNALLSGKRAQSVRQFLLSQGVTSKIIAVSDLGESKPLIDTRDEVEEPLNRRVEIITKNAKK